MKPAALFFIVIPALGCGTAVSTGGDFSIDRWPDGVDSLDMTEGGVDMEPCSPGTVRCNGTARENCSPAGWWVPAPCDAGQVCIMDGACVARMCTPGEKRCSTADPTVVERCRTDGTMWESVETCEDPYTCGGGECIIQVCTPGELRCSGVKYRECDAGGTGWSDPMDCPPGQACNEGTCAAIFCTPGTGSCVSDSVKLVCNATGTAEVEEECLGGYICLEGVCRLQICPAGLVRCLDDLAYEICNASGTAFDPGGSCSAVGGEKCVEGECLTACELAEAMRSSVGCAYYAVDTNPLRGLVGGDFAVALSNTDETTAANVVIEVKNGGVWAPVAGGTLTVNPLALQTVVLPHRYTSGSAIYSGGAYRITSDLPIIAYQFNPIDGSISYLSDASLLLPRSSLDNYHIVIHWPQGPADDRNEAGWPAFIEIAATAPTTVTVTSSIAAQAGSGVPALAPGVPTPFHLEEGDFLQLAVANHMESFSGTYIESDQPVAVFASNDCVNVPASINYCCCEHLEEQIFGLQTWGKVYVGSRVPQRAAEPAIWQILGSVDGTTVSFDFGPGVTGLPASTTVNRGQVAQFQVNGPGTQPGDFLVTADQPILVTQYMVAAFMVAPGGSNGDPSMVLAVPVEQFLSRYVVLVPTTWQNDYFVLTRQTGAAISIDGAPVSASWAQVGTSGFEVGRVSSPDGVHVVESDLPFGIIIVGWDAYDSYAYPGGLSLRVINPQD